MLFSAKTQTQANKVAIKDLTTNLGYVRTDVDLQKDRLDYYSGQLEKARITRERTGKQDGEIRNNTGQVVG